MERCALADKDDYTNQPQMIITMIALHNSCALALHGSLASTVGVYKFLNVNPTIGSHCWILQLCKASARISTVCTTCASAIISLVCQNE